MLARPILALALAASLQPQPTPAVSLSASRLTFGPTTVGSETPPEKVTFTNTSSATLEVRPVTSSDTIVFPVRDDCPAALRPTQRCTAMAIFIPAHPGTATATLSFAGRTVSISGTGTNP